MTSTAVRVIFTDNLSSTVKILNCVENIYFLHLNYTFSSRSSVLLTGWHRFFGKKRHFKTDLQKKSQKLGFSSKFSVFDAVIKSFVVCFVNVVSSTIKVQNIIIMCIHTFVPGGVVLSWCYDHFQGKYQMVISRKILGNFAQISAPLFFFDEIF